MEDILEVYARKQDEEYPLVCLDETTKQLVKETRAPVKATPDHVEYYDYEYQRNGVGTLFMLCAPLLGWRHVDVRQQKTRIDYAQVLKYLADECFASAQRIILVQDNLNTHHPSSLYHAFKPDEAQRIYKRFEFHYTPKHASWLNVAECELSALARQCLNRRIPNMASLKELVEAWQNHRNNQKVTIDWRFTTQDARIKLKRLYPSYHEC